MKFVKPYLAGLLLAIASTSLPAQSLNEKYDELLQKSETYEQYKVIPKASLDNFWSEVQDSVSQQNALLDRLHSEVDDLNQKIEVLTKSEANVQASLDESLTLNDSISFVGISLSKTSYHIIVWSLILVLIGLGLLAYTMFFRRNKLTTRHKKNLQELELEFEKHRNTARENQVKLKRELQTAINKLEARGKALS